MIWGDQYFWETSTMNLPFFVGNGPLDFLTKNFHNESGIFRAPLGPAPSFKEAASLVTHQLRLIGLPHDFTEFYNVLYMPGGFLDFLQTVIFSFPQNCTLNITASFFYHPKLMAVFSKCQTLKEYPFKTLWKIAIIRSTEVRKSPSQNGSKSPKSSVKHLQIGGWTNPFEKYARQIGSFPQVGVRIKKYSKPPTSLNFIMIGGRNGGNVQIPKAQKQMCLFGAIFGTVQQQTLNTRLNFWEQNAHFTSCCFFS